MLVRVSELVDVLEGVPVWVADDVNVEVKLAVGEAVRVRVNVGV